MKFILRHKPVRRSAQARGLVVDQRTLCVSNPSLARLGSRIGPIGNGGRVGGSRGTWPASMRCAQHLSCRSECHRGLDGEMGDHIGRYRWVRECRQRAMTLLLLLLCGVIRSAVGGSAPDGRSQPRVHLVTSSSSLDTKHPRASISQRGCKNT